jgi:hypothetical protein
MKALSSPLLSASLGGILALSTGCAAQGKGEPEYTENVEALSNMGEQSGSGGSAGGTATASGGSDAATGGSSSMIDPPDPVDNCPTDECSVPHGVSWRCRKRFVYGTNMAWSAFAADFGGVGIWDAKSISQDPQTFSNLLADMKSNGVNVVRWWMFPDFRGDGILFDQNGVPTGVSQTLLEDISRALELAATHDVYLMLTLFSFDGFKIPANDAHWSHYMTPLVTDPALRKALIDKVIRPIAQLVESHEHKIRLHSWDLINEPEWAMEGASLYAPDPAYALASWQINDNIDAVTPAEMEQFLAETNAALRQEGDALISVGASLKWPQAWTGLDVDFYQLHYYPWMEAEDPLDRTPAEIGLTDKPIVLGEFPGAAEFQSGAKYNYTETMDLLWSNGWAGALGWAYTSATAEDKSFVKDFAVAHPCETAY